MKSLAASVRASDAASGLGSMASSSAGEIAKFFQQLIDFEDSADLGKVVVADDDVDDGPSPGIFATAPVAGEDDEVNVAALGDFVLLTTTVRLHPWPSKSNPYGFASMSSWFRRTQSSYSSRGVTTEPSAFFRMVSTAGVMSASPCQSRGACRSEPNRASCTEASIGVPTVSISTDFALEVFGWEGVVNDDAGVDATRAECSARSDASWRLMKPSSRAFLLEGGIVDGENVTKGRKESSPFLSTCCSAAVSRP